MIPHVVAERVKPVTELPVPTSSVIYDIHVFEPHKGTYSICVVMPIFGKCIGTECTIRIYSGFKSHT